MSDSEPPQLRILCVCIGNICRSPLMERLLRHRLPEAEVHSAGVARIVGRAMHELSAAELARLGGISEGFLSRALIADEVVAADLVLTATTQVRRQVLEEAPAALHKTFTLLELAALDGHVPPGVLERDVIPWAARHRSLVRNQPLDVADPIGQPAEVHRQVADVMDQAVSRVVRILGH